MRLFTVHADRPVSTERRTPVSVFFCVWLVAVTALGAAMRLHNLSVWSFWEDELYSINAVTGDPPTLASQDTVGSTQWSKWLGYVPVKLGLMWSGADISGAAESRPHEWRSHGINEWRARIGPCIVGIVSIPILAFASVRMLGPRGAGILALLLAVSPWHLFWSQAARFYTLEFLLYNLAMVWYFTATEYDSRRVYLAAMVAVVLAYMSQPPAIFVGLIFAGDWLLGWGRRQPVRLGAFGYAVGFAALAICVALYLRDATVAAQNWEKWGKLDGHTWQVIIAGTVYENHLAVVVMAIVAGLGMLKLRPRLSSYLLMGAVLPTIPVILIALIPSAYSHTRYNFPVHFAFLALCALGLDAVHQAAQQRFNTMMACAATATLVAALLLSDFFQLTEGYGLRQRWQEGFNYILEHRKPGEQIISDRVLIAQYYLEAAEIPKFPQNPQQLHELDQPTWLILAAASATKGVRHPWLQDEAQLKAYFDLRVVQPFSSVRVFYFDPAGRDRP